MKLIDYANHKTLTACPKLRHTTEVERCYGRQRMGMYKCLEKHNSTLLEAAQLIDEPCLASDYATCPRAIANRRTAVTTYTPRTPAGDRAPITSPGITID